MANSPRIVVAGAGAIGCFAGGLLAAGGHNVALLLRPRIGAEIRAHGLTLTDFSGMALKVSAEDLTLTENPVCIKSADIVLVTVRSAATPVIARSIAGRLPVGAQLVSLQDGVENIGILRDLLPDHDLRAGLVPFNVVPMGQGCFHRATAGDVVIGAGPGALGAALTVPHLGVAESDQITSMQWGKFVINLNNALNALSGLTLHDQLRVRDWRRLMADQWAEALKVLKAHEIKPLSPTPVAASHMPRVLRLPTPLFTRVAGDMLRIDPQARTPMAHDLIAGRPTEIDSLQGQVLRMGAQTKVPTPINARVLEVVKLAELAAEGLPHLPAKALRSTD